MGARAESRDPARQGGAHRASLRPLPLLTGRAAASLRIAQPLATLEGELTLSVGGRIEGRDWHGNLILGAGGLLPAVPPDLEGRVALAKTLYRRFVPEPAPA